MRYSINAMRTELEAARRQGSVREITDLEMLVRNAERPRGSSPLPEARAAGNRQGQRRYGRRRSWDQNAHNRHRGRSPRPGDVVRVPSGELWPVTGIEDRTTGRMVISHLPGGACNTCPIGLVTLGDFVSPRTPEWAPTTAILSLGETLYHACWDALEANDWTALERALRDYEATAPEAGQ